jgi:hypothetical protein
MLRHNKKRNSYIIYEQLLSLTTRLAAQGCQEEAKHIVGFIKQYFHPSTEIGKEFKVLESLIGKASTKEEAEKILEESLSQSKVLNFDKLNKEKSVLIEQINKKISPKLFDMPVKEYKAMASAQILINEVKDNFANTTPGERVKIKNFLTERMSEKTPEIQTEKIDNFTFAVLVNKFNKKYAQLMNEDQRELLSAWSNFVIESKEEKINTVMESKVQKLKESLSSHISKNSQEDFKELLFEAYGKLSSSTFEANENSLYELMRYFDLVEELNNVQK